MNADDTSAANGSLGTSRRRNRSARGRRRSRTSGPTLGEALASGWGHALELGDYVRSWMEVRNDRAALDFRRRVTRIAVLAVVALGVATVIIAASLRLVLGLSDGLAALFGGPAWSGDLSAAVLLLGGLAGAGALYSSHRERKELEEHIEKYERNHRKHRARHGRHVGDPAAEEPGGAPRP